MGAHQRMEMCNEIASDISLIVSSARWVHLHTDCLSFLSQRHLRELEEQLADLLLSRLWLWVGSLGKAPAPSAGLSPPMWTQSGLTLEHSWSTVDKHRTKPPGSLCPQPYKPQMLGLKRGRLGGYTHHICSVPSWPAPGILHFQCPQALTELKISL